MERKPDIKVNAAPFLLKTFSLLENPAYEDIVKWMPGGESFAILNTDAMATKVLPTYFKSQNLCSFIRQLNTYGFHKVDGDHRLEFKHELFARSNPQNLSLIQRRKSVKRETEDAHVEKNKAAAPTPISPSGSENGDSHHSPFAEIPAAAGAASADANTQIAQIGSILQKILVELERVKREQSSLRQMVTGIQQHQQQQQLQQQHLQHLQQQQQQQQQQQLQLQQASRAPIPLDHEVIDVAGDLHRASLGETEWDFDRPIPIDELLGEVLQLDQVPQPQHPTQ